MGKMRKRRKIRILSITSLFPNKTEPNRGIFVLNRLKAMKKYAELEVIAPVAFFPFVRLTNFIPYEEKIEGLKIYHPKFFSIPKFFKFLDGYFFYLCLKKFSNKLKNTDLKNIDIIDSHFGYPDGFGSYLFARKYNKKFSITLRGRDVTYWQKKILIKNFFEMMLINSDVIISVSEALKKRITSKGILDKVIDRIKVIPNGVDTGHFFKMDRTKARKKLRLPINTKIFLSVGNNFKRKGYFELVEAFKKLNVKNRLLLIIGKDDNYNYRKLNKQIKGRNDIKLLKEVNHKELVYYYNACDVYCLVSHSEGCPNSIIEALACNKVCIATKEAAEDFINEDIDIGIITDYNNLSGNLKKAMEIKQDSKTIETIQGYIKKRTWEKTAHSTLNEFRKSLMI